MVRSRIAAIVVAPLILGSLPALAQSSPSADQIINSLKPSGNLVTGGTRGIRLAAPSTESTQQPWRSSTVSGSAATRGCQQAGDDPHDADIDDGAGREPDGQLCQWFRRTDA